MRAIGQNELLIISGGYYSDDTGQWIPDPIDPDYLPPSVPIRAQPGASIPWWSTNFDPMI